VIPSTPILVFAKTPIPGRVKSRLRPAFGARGAAGVYRRLFAHTLSVAAAADLGPVELWLAPGRGHPWTAALARRHGAVVRVQPRGGLGRRMHRALGSVLQRSPQALLVGADCPALTREQLTEAALILAEGRDVVLVPARDGGYALIGARQAPAVLFQGVRWSTSAVMRQTRSRLRRLGVRWCVLGESWDVDRPADLRRLRRERGIDLLRPTAPPVRRTQYDDVGSPAAGQYP